MYDYFSFQYLSVYFVVIFHAFVVRDFVVFVVFFKYKYDCFKMFHTLHFHIFYWILGCKTNSIIIVVSNFLYRAFNIRQEIMNES